MKRLFVLFTLFIGTQAHASFESYEEIVERLTKLNSSKAKSVNPTIETRTSSTAHIGLGLGQSFFDTSSSPLGSSGLSSQGGLIINLGVDLFNEQWGLEGSFANFGRENNRDIEVSLREFTLKGLYKPTLNKSWSMRLGLGVSSRFLDLASSNQNLSYRTPSGLFTLGLDSYLSSFISVGADLNFKTAMIQDTIDKNSVDLTFRIDTHF